MSEYFYYIKVKIRGSFKIVENLSNFIFDLIFLNQNTFLGQLKQNVSWGGNFNKNKMITNNSAIKNAPLKQFV